MGPIPDKFVTHYDAWCVAKNIHDYYEDVLYKNKIKDENAWRYVQRELETLRNKAKDLTNEDLSMTCPYCGDVMVLEFKEGEGPKRYSRISRSHYPAIRPTDAVGYKCWRCGASSPSIVVNARLLDKAKVKHEIENAIRASKEELEDELNDENEEEEFDDCDE